MSADSEPVLGEYIPETLRAMVGEEVAWDPQKYLWAGISLHADAWEAENARLAKRVDLMRRAMLFAREELVMGGNWADAIQNIDAAIAEAEKP